MPPCCSPSRWTSSDASSRRNVGQAEIVADEQQGIVGDGSRGLGKTVAEVERRRVAAAAEAEERRDRRMPFAFAERHDRDAQFLHQRDHLAHRRRSTPASEDHARFDQGWRRDAHAPRDEDAVDEIEMLATGFWGPGTDKGSSVNPGTPLIVYRLNDAQSDPYPAQVSANRVTDEFAPVAVVAPGDRW